MPKTAVFFDLDGTLTNPHEGILSCINGALEACAIEPTHIPTGELCIGPPLRQVFRLLTRPDDQHLISQLCAAYQERYTEFGWRQSVLYPSIDSLLARLMGLGIGLYMATSKVSIHAHRIAHHVGIDRYFKAIYGSEPDGTRSDKTELLAHALADQNMDGSGAIMVGDRSHDIIAARRLGMLSVGVTWGFGSQRELADTGADVIVGSHEQLAQFVENWFLKQETIER